MEGGGYTDFPCLVWAYTALQGGYFGKLPYNSIFIEPINDVLPPFV